MDDAVSGYSGGKTNKPTYDEVSSETTGHAEAILVYYNPQKVSYHELVKVIFASHDPTTPHQQGPDRGSLYIYYGIGMVFYQLNLFGVLSFVIFEKAQNNSCFSQLLF